MGYEKHLEKKSPAIDFRIIRMLIVGLLCVCSVTVSFAQGTVVSGMVRDDAGEPVIGAAVLIKGTNTGTVTDLDGRFKFQTNDLNGVLVISFVGMDTKEIPMKGKKVFNDVVLHSSNILEEVQVVAYGSQKKGDVDGRFKFREYGRVNKNSYSQYR